jgi:hypothetical protein
MVLSVFSTVETSSNLVHLTETAFKWLSAGIGIEVLVSAEEVCTGFFPPVFRCGRLRVPPGMIDIYHIERDIFHEFGLKPGPSIGRFQVCPIMKVIYCGANGL